MYNETKQSESGRLFVDSNKGESVTSNANSRKLPIPSLTVSVRNVNRIPYRICKELIGSRNIGKWNEKSQLHLDRLTGEQREKDLRETLMGDVVESMLPRILSNRGNFLASVYGAVARGTRCNPIDEISSFA